MKLSPMIVGGIIIAILALGGGIYLITMDGGDGDTTTTTEVATGDRTDPGNTKEACDVFTLEIARSVLGESAAREELPAGAEASTENVNVTNCAYGNGGKTSAA